MTTYTMEQYQKDVQRTLSAFERIGELDENWLRQELEALVAAAKRADFLKKLIFYKSREVPDHAKADLPWVHVLDQRGVDILHGAIGMLSEAGEVIEHMIGPIFRCQNPDYEHLKYEFGDQAWYLSVQLTAGRFTFEEVGEANIAKLKARWPGKFVGGSETRGN